LKPRGARATPPRPHRERTIDHASASRRLTHVAPESPITCANATRVLSMNMTSTPVATPAANPLADLLQDEAFLDLVTRRQRVSMADLPDLLVSLADSTRHADQATLRELIELVSNAVRRNLDLASSATFAIFPEPAWRSAQGRLPMSESIAPDDMVWAESGFSRGCAIIAPNTGAARPRLMLYKAAPAPSGPNTTALVPVEIPITPGEPPITPPACVLKWVEHGEYSTLGCFGQCDAGTCTAERYQASGRPEVVTGCYCC